MRNLNRRAVLASAAALTAGSALAQGMAPFVRVALTTADGAILLELEAAKAPITTANFLRYVDAGRFDGAAFYRAVKTGHGAPAGLIQGGLRNDPAKLFPPIAHESTRTTGLTHTDGVISMARYEPGSATSDFFICVGDQLYLDADPTLPGDDLGFAAFGRVVQGMDVVRTILLSPRSPTAGEGSMRGQMLDPVVAISQARRA